jgi:hypothetical protein
MGTGGLRRIGRGGREEVGEEVSANGGVKKVKVGLKITLRNGFLDVKIDEGKEKVALEALVIVDGEPR